MAKRYTAAQLDAIFNPIGMYPCDKCLTNRSGCCGCPAECEWQQQMMIPKQLGVEEEAKAVISIMKAIAMKEEADRRYKGAMQMARQAGLPLTVIKPRLEEIKPLLYKYTG